MIPLICHGTTRECLNYFTDNISKLENIIKMTTFEDSENFIFTKYEPFCYASMGAILEGENGLLMFLDGLNCGYSGEGPTGTEKVLERLGISDENAEKWKCESGLSIDFTRSEDENTQYGLIHAPFFAYQTTKRNNYSQFELGTYAWLRVGEHQIIMLNPQNNRFNDLLNILQVSGPYQMEVCYGQTPEYLFDGIALKELIPNLSSIRGYEQSQKMNLAIYGQKFDILCFIDKDVILSTSNCIYSYLTGKPLFTEASDNGIYFQNTKRENGILSLLKKQPIWNEHIKRNIGRSDFKKCSIRY